MLIVFQAGLNIEFNVDKNAKFHRLYSAILGAVKGNPNPSVDIKNIKLQQKQIVEQKGDIQLKADEPEKKAPNLPLRDIEDQEFDAALALSLQSMPLEDQELDAALALSLQNTPLEDQELDAALILSLTDAPLVDLNLDDVYAENLQAALDLEAEQLRAAHEASLAGYTVNQPLEAQKGRPLEAKQDALSIGDLLRKELELKPAKMVKDWTNQRARNEKQMKILGTPISPEEKQKATDRAKVETEENAAREQERIQAERVKRLQALEKAKVQTEKQEKAAAEERAAREQARIQAERAKHIRELEIKKQKKTKKNKKTNSYHLLRLRN